MAGMSRRVGDPWVLLPPAELVARVVTGPPPRIPLASLAHLLEPRHDSRGELVDWVLRASELDARDAIPTYLAWRSSWRQEWPIGPISNLASLHAEVLEIDHDLDRALGPVLQRAVLSGGTGLPLTGDGAQHLLQELETVRLALSVDHRTGWGIVDDMPAATRSLGLARTWAPPREEVTLAATTTSAVVLRPGHNLVLLHGGPHHQAFPGVTAVEMRADQVVVLDDRGGSLRLPLEECRPLAWLVPRSLRWHVRPVPIVVVWAPLFQGLAEALRAVVASGGWIELSSDAGVV